jgi:hypothetical protein
MLAILTKQIDWAVKMVELVVLQAGVLQAVVIKVSFV